MLFCFSGQLVPTAMSLCSYLGIFIAYVRTAIHYAAIYQHVATLLYGYLLLRGPAVASIYGQELQGLPVLFSFRQKEDSYKRIMDGTDAEQYQYNHPWREFLICTSSSSSSRASYLRYVYDEDFPNIKALLGSCCMVYVCLLVCRRCCSYCFSFVS